jgi:hypothetical protein
VPLGHVVNVSSSASDGVTTMTVSLVTIQSPGAIGTAGSGVTTRVAVANVRACAGAQGSQSGVSLSSFSLIGKGDFALGALSSSGAGLFGTIGADQCVTGSITFPVMTGMVPTAVQYWPEPIQNYEWSTPRS